MAAKIDRTIDVLVVGGGGCGLVISIFLADKGVDFLTIERHASTSILPKAHYLNQRTMEIFRQHGLADDVYAQGTPPYNGRGPNGIRRWAATSARRQNDFEMGALGGQGHRDRSLSRDVADRYRKSAANRLEPLIKSHARNARLRASDSRRTRPIHPGRGRCHRDDPRRQDQEDGNRPGEILVAADGGRTVGRMLGSRWMARPSSSPRSAVHFEADLSQWIPDDRVLLNWLKPMHRQGVSVICTDGVRANGGHGCPGMVARLSPHAVRPALRSAMRRRPKRFLRASASADLPVEARCVSEWAVEGVLAERYRVGRVFLAGRRRPPSSADHGARPQHRHSGRA